MANLAYGSTGSDVRKLQEQLKAAGYNIGVDGVFGKETQNAVRQYQQAKGLVADGIAGGQTLGALGGNYGGSAQASGGSGYNNGGLTSAQIKEMQNYYGTAADGLWGQNSTNAAGGLSAQQAWQQYQQGKQQQMQETMMPGMMGFEDFYNRMGGSDFEAKLRETIGASVQQAVDAYEAQKQDTEQDAQELARQAYIAKRLGEKNMAQQLAASGYAGGVAESAMLESEANYQNQLSEIQRQRQQALNEIQRAIDNARLTGDMEMASQLGDYLAQVQNYYSDYYNQTLAAQQEAAAAAAATPSGGSGAGYTGGYANNEGVSTNTVKMLQQQINSTLPAGQKIAVDGVWGPATTAAAGGMSASQYLDAYDSYMNRYAYQGGR